MKEKGKYKIVIFLLLGLCLILAVSLISAQQNFKQNNIIDLKVQCIINGSYCSTNAKCNITVLSPNNTLLLNNQKLTNQYSYYNYTSSLFTDVGNYKCSSTCCDIGFCGTEPCDFTITPSGFEISTGQAIIYIISLGFGVIIFFLLLYASLKIPFTNLVGNDGQVIGVNNLKFFKIGAIAGAYLVLMFLFATLNSMTTNFMYSGSGSRLFEWLYNIMLAVMYPLAILSIVLGFVVFIHDLGVKKKMKRRYWR